MSEVGRGRQDGASSAAPSAAGGRAGGGAATATAGTVSRTAKIRRREATPLARSFVNMVIRMSGAMIVSR